MPDAPLMVSTRCATPDCPNDAYDLLCPSCQARRNTEPSLEQSACIHAHSITGDFAMVQRLLPSYAGGQPQDGYMLDICKLCLKELPERPYNPVRAMGHHVAHLRAAATLNTILPVPTPST